MTHYDGRIPVIGKGETDTLTASDFGRGQGCRASRLAAGLIHWPGALPTTMGRLFDWARRVRLLTGQRAVAVDEAFADVRNRVAHPEHFSVHSLTSAARTLCNVAEIVNRLWSVETRGGRRFPAPVSRRARAAAVAADGTGGLRFPTLASVRAVEPECRDWTFAVYRAAESEELCRSGGGAIAFAHGPGFQTTRFPCQLLWGPGSWVELARHPETLERDHAVDQTPHLDRVFLIRLDGGEVDDPRSPADFAAIYDGLDGEWRVICADDPADARRDVRDELEGEQHPLTRRRCAACRITELGRFSDATAARQFLQDWGPEGTAVEATPAPQGQTGPSGERSIPPGLPDRCGRESPLSRAEATESTMNSPRGPVSPSRPRMRPAGPTSQVQPATLSAHRRLWRSRAGSA